MRSPCPAPAGTFIETEQGEIRFPEISTPVLEAVCKYFYYKARLALFGSCCGAACRPLHTVQRVLAS